MCWVFLFLHNHPILSIPLSNPCKSVLSCWCSSGTSQVARLRTKLHCSCSLLFHRSQFAHHLSLSSPAFHILFNPQKSFFNSLKESTLHYINLWWIIAFPPVWSCNPPEQPSITTTEQNYSPVHVFVSRIREGVTSMHGKNILYTVTIKILNIINWWKFTL